MFVNIFGDTSTLLLKEMANMLIYILLSIAKFDWNYFVVVVVLVVTVAVVVVVKYMLNMPFITRDVPMLYGEIPY